MYSPDGSGGSAVGTARVLVVDDDLGLRNTLVRVLAAEGHQVAGVPSAEAALERLAQEVFDVVVSDLQLDGMDGLQLCERAAGTQPGLPVIVLTAFGSLDTAVAALRAGAYDFLSKPVDPAVVISAVARAVEHHRLRSEVKRLRNVVAAQERFDLLLGRSAPMRALFDVMERAAESEVTVLITGESGTGKELVARALHRRGRRATGPFVAINCTAVPETLLESELFGHTRGAFTDAKHKKDGLFVQANGGTLFLDEIGDMPLTMQGKLLRALQERTVRPIGSVSEVPFDVRVIAATHRDLDRAVTEERFREDLYYRLNVVHLDIPALRERGNDKLLLAQQLLERAAAGAGREISGLAPDAARKILDYSWPGNVRELQNCMERAVALTRFDHVTVDDLPPKVRNHRSRSLAFLPSAPDELVPLEEVERRYILRALEAVGGNRTRAAEILGLDRKTLRRKLARWDDVERPPDSGDKP